MELGNTLRTRSPCTARTPGACTSRSWAAWRGRSKCSTAAFSRSRCRPPNRTRFALLTRGPGKSGQRRSLPRRRARACKALRFRFPQQDDTPCVACSPRRRAVNPAPRARPTGRLFSNEALAKRLKEDCRPTRAREPRSGSHHASWLALASRHLSRRGTRAVRAPALCASRASVSSPGL